jgi:hypothetical protein
MKRPSCAVSNRGNGAGQPAQSAGATGVDAARAADDSTPLAASITIFHADFSFRLLSTKAESIPPRNPNK